MKAEQPRSERTGIVAIVVYGLLILLMIVAMTQVAFTLSTLMGGRFDPRLLMLFMALSPVITGLSIVLAVHFASFFR